MAEFPEQANAFVAVAAVVALVAFVALVAVAAFPPIERLAAVPDMFVPTKADGVPKFGVTNVGLFANTAAPVPVSSDNAAAKFALDGVAKNAAIPVANPETPVEIGRPVQLVKVPEVGVPKIGVTNVGVLANTFAPVPVSSVKAAARLAEVNEPSEVALPTEVTAPVKLALVVTLPAVKPAAVPVMFVPTKALGVPNAGVTSVGLFANTFAPVPVSSVRAAAKLAEVNDPSEVALPTEVTAPVKLALVVTVLALPVKLAVIVPAAKLPDPSRNTKVLAVFVEA